MSEDGRWVLLLPYRRLPLSANDRPHYQAKARITAEIRRDAWALAKAHRIPALKAVMVEFIHYPGNNVRHDGGNAAPTLKALIDGLVDAHVLPDDDSSRVLSESLRAVARRDDPYDLKTPRMVLVIRDASALAPLDHYGPEA